MVKTKAHLIVGILLAFFILFNVCIEVAEANNNEYRLGPGSSAKITYDYHPNFYTIVSHKI
ncbi:MAG TPA: hypothetical protein GX525_06605 [Bacilli bacterium]|nr:hypothetical protein [Bacilli bacterium]